MSNQYSIAPESNIIVYFVIYQAGQISEKN